jgi:hypothetical protein
MKSEIFTFAISHRNQLRFNYGFSEVFLDPYYISRDKSGKKVIYGRINNSSEIKKFDYDKIVNIRVLLYKRFSPVIPIISLAAKEVICWT